MARLKRVPRRGDIYWVRLDPAIGTEVKKTRPAVVLSNNVQNSAGLRVLAAPITSNVSKVYSFEAPVVVKGRGCKAMLDQVRCLDQSRLKDFAGQATEAEIRGFEAALRVTFDLV